MSKEIPYDQQFPYVIPPPLPNAGEKLTLRVGRYKGFKCYWIIETDSGKMRKRPTFYNIACIAGILELAGVLPTST